ncbi:AraC family transcriptional regulator N-terminal domain-containing protein [Micromonospora sp. NPDC092111]|uniref:AraC family transcriptional regulator n=1 Tax=Micromonospora sp. NPDC092111 TaxID=3364289 RepID=UPI0038000AF7
MSLDELRDLLVRHARPDVRTPIEDVLVFKAEQPYPPTPTTYGKVLALVAQGAKRFALGDQVHEYRAGQYLVASIDLPVASHFSEASPDLPGLGVGLTLDPSTVADLLLHAPRAELPDIGTGTPPGLAISTASPELLDAVIRLLRLLDTPRDIAVLAPLIKREILWRLIVGDQGAVVRQLGLADSSLIHIARAIRWIRDNYRQPFRVEVAAQLASMSVSAFYRNFQAVTGMSPIQYQKQIRLHQARLLLAHFPSDIAGVSRRVGYESPSQFSREYRRQFGAPPSRDADRLHTVSTLPR